MAKNHSIIKPIEIPQGISQSEINSFARIDFPLFSFRYLQETSFVKCKLSSFFVDFIIRLKKLSQLGWKIIDHSSRHGFGLEKIPQNILVHKLPSAITPEVPIYAFRAKGNNLPFVGFREGKVFHIIFIESRFGDIYQH